MRYTHDGNLVSLRCQRGRGEPAYFRLRLWSATHFLQEGRHKGSGRAFPFCRRNLYDVQSVDALDGIAYRGEHARDPCLPGGVVASSGINSIICQTAIAERPEDLAGRLICLFRDIETPGPVRSGHAASSTVVARLRVFRLCLSVVQGGVQRASSADR